MRMIKMNSKIIIVLFLLGISLPAIGQELRTVKGKVVTEEGQPFPGARVSSYDKVDEHVVTNFDGEFELQLPTNKKVIRITYGCSAYRYFLYELKNPVDAVVIEIFTRKSTRVTKRIQKRLDRNKG